MATPPHQCGLGLWPFAKGESPLQCGLDCVLPLLPAVARDSPLANVALRICLFACGGFAFGKCKEANPPPINVAGIVATFAKGESPLQCGLE